MKCGYCDSEMMRMLAGWRCTNPACEGFIQMVGTNKISLASVEPERGHGIKLDSGKIPVYTEFLMQFPRAIKAVARIGDEGTRAPGHVRSGWQGVPTGFERYSNAMARHLIDEVIWATTPNVPEEINPDIALVRAVATQAWNTMARLELLLREHPEWLDTDPEP